MTYRDKCRVAAFGNDVQRTVDLMVPHDVVDIINPTIVKARESAFNKDMTIPYELRINGNTRMELFRQDARNRPNSYVMIVLLSLNPFYA